MEKAIYIQGSLIVSTLYIIDDNFLLAGIWIGITVLTFLFIDNKN